MHTNELIALFQERFSRPPRILGRAPGRVNLLGEHVDYNDGIVLPAAIDREVLVAAARLEEPEVHLYAADLKQGISFRLDEVEKRQDINGGALPGWARYPAGVAWSLQQAGLEVSGMQAVYTSSIPIGAGLSSSAAVEMAFCVTWRAFGGWKTAEVELARLAQRAENQYVGVNCGLMDQFASACGVEDHLLHFDTRSLEWFPLPLPPGTVIVIADSGVRRSLANSAYNERRAACEKAVELMKHYLPNIRSLRDVSSVELAAYSEFLPPEIYKRAEHVVKEIARVEQAVHGLRRGDAKLFGGLMYSGHASLRDLYEVSCKELDILVQATRHIPGCYGARLTGAGFGGCTVNLVAEDQAQAFIESLRLEYQRQTGREASIYLCHAVSGATAGPLR